MRFCYLSKYPPLEGGVSTVNYWLARGLAQKGHNICVVTNALEAESCYKWSFEKKDDHFLTQSFPDSGGEINIFYTSPFDSSQFHIIPNSPFVTKLTSLALKCIKEYQCEFVFSHYLEPYAIAGYLASRWAHIPHIITHSGSDIGRLMKHSELAPVYQNIVHEADLFIAKNRVAASLFNTSLYSADFKLNAYSPSQEFFNPHLQPLNINYLIETHKVQIEKDIAWEVKPFNSSLPTILFFGKLFKEKHIFEIIEALSQLKAEGKEFNLLLMCRWKRYDEKLKRLLKESNIKDKTYILPYIPNWKIGSLIKACTAVCYLEHAWTLPIHTPIIPKEVLACGGVLVVSKEIALSGLYKENLHHQENCIVVDNPQEISQIYQALKIVLEDANLRNKISLNAVSQFAKMSSYEDFINGWEKVFLKTRGLHDVK